MPPKVKVYVVVGCLAFAAALSIASGATKPGVADAAYEGFSVTPPTPTVVFVCHGFGCKYRAELDLTGSDRAKLAQLLAAGKSSAAAERKAVGVAGAWFDRRVGPVAGTMPVATPPAFYSFSIS